MTWRQIEKVIRGKFEVAVEADCTHNKYWIRKTEPSGPIYYPISSLQFERLLENGYIDPDYRVEHGNGLYGADQMIYEGR